MNSGMRISYFLISVVGSLEFLVQNSNAHSGHTLPMQQQNISESDANQKAMLLSAVRRGEMREVANLIRAGVLELYSNAYLGRQKLEMIHSKIRAVEVLLSTGITLINSQWNDIKNSSSSKGSFEVVLVPGTDLSLRLQINVATVNSWSNERVQDGRKPLHIICNLPDVHPDVVKIVLENGKDGVNVKSDSNVTPLILASMNGNLALVKYLVKNGANINDYATISVDTAEYDGHFAYAKLFSNRALLISQVEIHYSSLVAAVIGEHLEILRFLIDRGADVNNNSQGWVALFHPVTFGKKEIFDLLLQNDIDVQSKDIFNSTALHKAAEAGEVEIAKLLLKKGANVNSTDMLEWTPLHVASFFSRKSGKEMIQCLVEARSDVDALTDGGYSSLNLVEAGSNLAFLKYLIENFDQHNPEGHRDLQEVDLGVQHTNVIDYLLHRGAPLNVQDDVLGWSPLHWAAASGDLNGAKQLVKYGAVVSTRSKKGLNPFEVAKYFGRQRVADYLSTAKDLVR